MVLLSDMLTEFCECTFLGRVICALCFSHLCVDKQGSMAYLSRSVTKSACFASSTNNAYQTALLLRNRLRAYKSCTRRFKLNFFKLVLQSWPWLVIWFLALRDAPPSTLAASTSCCARTNSNHIRFITSVASIARFFKLFVRDTFGHGASALLWKPCFTQVECRSWPQGTLSRINYVEP